MGSGYGMGFGGGVMWLFWIALLILAIWIIRSAITGGDNSPGKSNSALDILKERFAKGEIDQQEFEQKRKALGGS
jgi:putative membrane protein